jgi:hypothetical protein
MVRKKQENINFIECKNSRHNTFQKRKRGFLKKAIEFCHLCGLDIYIVIHDPEKQKLIEFKSQKNFKLKDVKKLIKKRGELSYEGYTKKDFWRFVPKDLKSEMEREGIIPEDEPSL